VGGRARRRAVHRAGQRLWRPAGPAAVRLPGYGGENLEHISWDDWFTTFDERELNFLYQEHRKDGSQSNFFQLENPGR
jgi:hypothetical protein